MTVDRVTKIIELESNGTPFADGLGLANAMIAEALQHILFYTKGCPACTYAVLGAMFDLTLEGADRIHNRIMGGKLEVMADTSGYDSSMMDLAIIQHRILMQPKLRAYLREAQKRGAKVHVENDEEEVVMH